VSRIQFASNTPSDLLLSVHHDSVPNKFLEKWMFEGKERAYCDRFSGHSLFVSAEAPEYRASLAFARAIGLELRARGLRYTPHYTEKFMGPRQRQLVDAEAGVYRFDNLAVLRFTNTPAVLLEAGSIINRAEELEMASPQRQELIAGAVVAAVERYCNANGNRRHEPRIRRAGAGPASAPAAAPILFPFLFGRAVEQ
jgi:N-acetylmuramoyl-L-alanine amidase